MKARKACAHCLKTWSPTHTCPEMDAMGETMRSMREAVRKALQGRTVQSAAVLAECSENTIQRILRGENVMIMTAARIATRLGSKIIIRLEDLTPSVVEYK